MIHMLFVNLGFAPVFPEFLCQFCGIPPLMPFSTNPSEVPNNEDSLLKKKVNSYHGTQHHLLTQWVAQQAGDQQQGWNTSLALISLLCLFSYCLSC